MQHFNLPNFLSFSYFRCHDAFEKAKQNKLNNKTQQSFLEVLKKYPVLVIKYFFEESEEYVMLEKILILHHFQPQQQKTPWYVNLIWRPGWLSFNKGNWVKG